MGTLFGGKLALAGAEVTMVDVVPEAVESMRRDGLVLELLDGVHRAPVEAYLAQDVPFIADLVVLFTKSLYSPRSAGERTAVHGQPHGGA